VVFSGTFLHTKTKSKFKESVLKKRSRNKENNKITIELLAMHDPIS
jgi:hypothetical protein